MAKQTIALGTAPTGTGGDTPRSAFTKAQANFDELYNGVVALATTAAAGRTALGLGSAALLDSTTLVTKAASGIATSSAPEGTSYDTPGGSQGGGFYKVGAGPSSSGMSYAAMIRSPYAPNYEAQIYFPMGAAVNKMYFRCALGNSGGTFGAAQEIYHTGNTTRAADGTLKAI